MCYLSTISICLTGRPIPISLCYPSEGGTPVSKDDDRNEADEPETDPLKQTKLGYAFDEVTSAMQKEIRRGDEEAAVYWALLLHGKSPQYAWKRVLVTAAEDIGLGDPQTVAQVYSLATGWKVAKEGAWHLSPHALTLAVVLLCRAKKDTTIEDLQTLTMELIKRNVKREIPVYALDGHTRVGKQRRATWDEWYRARHILFRMPINDYTRRLWKLIPKWRPQECPDSDAGSEPK